MCSSHQPQRSHGVDAMEWPTVMETLSVSGHRQVDLVPWPVAAPDAEPDDARTGDPVRPAIALDAEAATQAGPERDAW